ncbi:MAG: hypothetical protein E5X33_10935 [Mesorhizobium sp.]|uniref:hypothetical protein n=1 Tax=Mesorhizobium sp. TaxID=1871066 RepID=UPI000FE795C8|nr:hypothetical protein [Mesorhizobium sp.]RWI95474.1 MAG: hypothetical protein EOR22_09090 [Mesorhizobium sp.]TIR21595.1 MAG: hypothetical protein E5X33_10935 [Mesorhizobium sp.]
MGEVVQFVPRPRSNELAELIAWIKPASDWRTGQMQIALAYHFYMTADYRRILARGAHGKDSTEALACSVATEQACNLWRAECLKQMFIPARTVRHLRWKQEWLRVHGAGARKLTASALARDEVALADRLAVVRRQQAGRKAVQG